MALASFVASTQFWRLLEMARPTTCSELPFEYASAVSIKLMPASRALATIRVDVASSVRPPNIMVPRHIGEIFRPLRPSWRYSIGQVLTVRYTPPRPALAGRGEEIRILSEQRPQSFFNILNTPLAMAIQR